MLGFRGHFSSKSRRYSITLGRLPTTRPAPLQQLVAAACNSREPMDTRDLEALLLANDDGEVIFHNPDDAFSIGRVLVWEPGARYAQTFTLAQDVDYPTILTVTFAAVPGGTCVRVEHGGWNAANADRRSHFADWSLILSRVGT